MVPFLTAGNVQLQLQYASVFVAKATLVWYKYTHNYINFVESKLDIIVLSSSLWYVASNLVIMYHAMYSYV